MLHEAQCVAPKTVRFASRVWKLDLSIAITALTLACGSDPTGGHTAGMRFVSGPLGDTVLVVMAEPLVVEVGAPRGTPVVFRASTVPWTDGSSVSSLVFSRSSNGAAPRVTDTLTTDASGRASVYLCLGSVAAEVVVTAFAPTRDDSAQVRITIRPGAPARVVAAPKDTAVYVGRDYTLRASLADAHGNLLPSAALMFQSDSAAVAVRADGKISGQAIGRARIVVSGGTFTDTAWSSVVPEGRIAAVRYGSAGTALVIVDLDGSAWRSFPLQPFDVPRPAWHPSGGYLVASILSAAGSTDPARRLAALDTATGRWRSLLGTPAEWGDGYAQFSRDGQWIYLANSPTNRYFSGSSAIYRVRSDGSGTAEPVGFDRDNGVTFDHPSPSPDGSRIAMTVDGTSGMYTLIVPASPPLGTAPPWFGLVDALPTGGHPEWSPVGDDMLMFGSEGMWLMQAGAHTVNDRRYLARQWANPSHVTGGFEGASWSPDGRWIVAKASLGLILVEVATDRVLPLAFGTQLTDPAWRPNYEARAITTRSPICSRTVDPMDRRPLSRDHVQTLDRGIV